MAGEYGYKIFHKDGTYVGCLNKNGHGKPGQITQKNLEAYAMASAPFDTSGNPSDKSDFKFVEMTKADAIDEEKENKNGNIKHENSKEKADKWLSKMMIMNPEHL